MGSGSSMHAKDQRGGMYALGTDDPFDVNHSKMDGQIQRNDGIVNHFMPPTFPLEAFLDDIMMAKCRYTWDLIMSGRAEGMKNSIMQRAGIVLYYDEFFFRLFKRARCFLDIFADPAKRGEVLMKAMGFMLRLDGDDSPAENKKLFYLGKAHRFKDKVRPWHFSVYIETALETLMFWLGADADVEAGESWTCLAAYTLRRMLSAYLVDQVLPNEFYQNYEIDAIRKIMSQSVHSRSLTGKSQRSSQGGRSQRGDPLSQGSQRGT